VSDPRLVVIRPTTETDRKAIEAHLVATWRATYAALIGVAAVDDMLRGMHASKDLIAFLCCPGAQLLAAVSAQGGIIGTIAMGASENVSYITAMYVRPAHQRQGLGTSLLQAVLDSAAPDKPVALSVLALRPEVLDFYRRFGFEARGRSSYRVGHTVCETIELVRRAVITPQ
jgi:GNAT superfamily N-acetyltransferase